MPVKGIVLTFHQGAISSMALYNRREVITIKSMKHYYPNEMNGVCVVRRKGESDDDLLKRFRKKFSKSGIAKEVRDRMYYEKPSDKRRRKKAQSIRMQQREEEKLEKAKEKAKKYKAKKDIKMGKERKNDSSTKRQSYRRRNDKSKDFRRSDNS